MQRFLILFALLALLVIPAIGQSYYLPGYKIDSPEPDWTSPTTEFRYILVYREWKAQADRVYLFEQTTSRPAPAHFENRVVGFDTKQQMLDWLNTNVQSGWYSPTDAEQKYVRFGEGAIVAIYDIDRMERIKVTLKKKDRVRESKREVVTDEKKWTDQWWEIK